FQHRQAFAEVRLDGRFDDFTGRLGHQAADAAELTNLIDVTTSAGDGHHGDRIEIAKRAAVPGRNRAAGIVAIILIEAGHQVFGDLLAGVAPDVDELSVAFLLGDGAHAIVLLDGVGLLLAFFENAGLALGSADIGDAEG